MGSFEFKDVIEVIALCGTVLLGTWRLSSQISALSAKFDAHTRSDDEKFRGIEDDLNAIAPRAVTLARARR
jgi:hypothetical protein